MKLNKTKVKVEIATKATIKALENIEGGQCIVKKKLIPMIVSRAEDIWEDEYVIEFDEEAMTPPDYNFIKARWAEICLQAADQFKKFVLWEPRIGVRLGSFEEFQKTRNLLERIANGIAKNSNLRNKIVVEQGGQSFTFNITIKQLTAGDDEESE